MKERQIDFNITTQSLLEAEVQYGNSFKILHRSMKEYVYGYSTTAGLNKNLCIFDLDKTLKKIQEICNILYFAGLQNKEVLLVGTKDKIREVVDHIGTSSKVLIASKNKTVGMHFLSKRFIPGLFTNFETFQNKLRKNDQFKHQLAQKGTENISKNMKKITNRKVKKINKEDLVFKGIFNMSKVPNIVIVIDINYEKQCITEAKKMGVTVVGLIDTDSNCHQCDYFIPCNEESSKSVSLILEELKNAYISGLQKSISKLADKKQSTSI